MANEIKVASQSTPTDVISNAISRALIEKVVCLPHVFTEQLPVGTVTKLARKDDALGLAAEVSEAGNHSITSGDNFTQGEVSLTVAKTVKSVRVSVEAMRFTSLSDAEIIAKISSSISRKLDNDIKTLIDGLSQTLDASGDVTAEILMQAAYLVEEGNAGRDTLPLIYIGHKKSAFKLKKEALYSSANAFTSSPSINLLSGLTTPAGWFGRLPGIELYQVSGLATTGSNTKTGVFNPDLAFFGMYGDLEIARTAPNSQGLYTEICGYVFHQAAEWNDGAGVEVQSLT